MSTRSSTEKPSDFYIVSLDIGSSSIRALLFDAEARQLEGYGARVAYEPTKTSDGGAEIDAAHLADLTIDCLDELHRQVDASEMRIAAVAGSAFWHSFLGVDENGRPTLPILHLLDTRSAEEVARVPDRHAITGCVPHSSYWPAKMLWLAKHRAAEFTATRRWLSFPEFLFEKLFGRARASLSMISATGLWHQNANDWDDESVAAAGIRRDQLPKPGDLDQPLSDLAPEFRAMWPRFDGIPWFPALGDGACSNLGCGSISPDRFALMVGTTGAMRAVIASNRIDIAPGLWCYRVDRKRFVTGGALSNGGDVFAWMKRTLVLPKDVESRLEKSFPGKRTLPDGRMEDDPVTVLPFLSGERSPYWRADLRGVIAGLSQATEPFDILRASLESVALRFREIHAILSRHFGNPREIIATGGGLLNSPAWTQMMADAIGSPITACTEPEGSSRGAALWALEQTGAISSIDALPASLGATFEPRAEHHAAYDRLLATQRELYRKIYE